MQQVEIHTAQTVTARNFNDASDSFSSLEEKISCRHLYLT